MKRVPVALLMTISLAGCTNLGLDGAPPLDEARSAPAPELVAEVHARPGSGTEIVIDGTLWVPWGAPGEHDGTGLRAVGSTHGLTVYARGWDRAPFDALFAAEPSGAWQEYAPVIDGGSAGGTGSTGAH